jgi:hypothetical protein
MSSGDLDDDCATVAAELVNRAREEELMAAHLRSTLPAMQAVAAALTTPADRTAGKPRRKRRTIRIARDDDGAMVAEDIEPAPVVADVGEAPAIEIEGEQAPQPKPTPGGFSDVFGSLEGL